MSLTKEDLQAIEALLDSKLAKTQAELREYVRDENEKSEKRIMQWVNVLIESKVMHELKIIGEGLGGWNERNRRIDRLERERENHGHRIRALEQVVKKTYNT